MPTRQADGRTPDRYITLSSMDATSVITLTSLDKYFFNNYFKQLSLAWTFSSLVS